MSCNKCGYTFPLMTEILLKGKITISRMYCPKCGNKFSTGYVEEKCCGHYTIFGNCIKCNTIFRKRSIKNFITKLKWNLKSLWKKKTQ